MPAACPDRNTAQPSTLEWSTRAQFNPQAVQQDLGSLAMAIADKGELVGRLLPLAAQWTGALAAAYYVRDEQGQLTLGRRMLLAGGPAAESLDDLSRAAIAACTEQAPQISRMAGEWTAISVPVELPGSKPEVLAVVFSGIDQRPEAVLLVLQLVAGHLTLWSVRQSAGDLEWQAETAAVILELIEQIARANDLKTACFTLAEKVREFQGCEQVVIGLIEKAGGRCKLAAISGIADLDHRTQAAGLLESALKEAVRHDAAASWPGNETERQGFVSHARLLESSTAGRIHSAPLRGPDGRIVGAWLMLGGEAARDDRRNRFLAACAGPVGSALENVKRTSGGHGFSWLARVRLSRWKLKVGGCVGLGVAALLCLPLHYRIACDCEIQPVRRRFVAAPFEGVFDKSLVKPGDLVRSGQVLGSMDGRELRLELAGLTADQQRAAKSRDVNLATGKVAAAQIDGLEMRRLELKRRVLAERVQHLEIRSPITGVVISGDLERSEGVPVTVGQSLYEVSPLAEMVSEVAIPDDEVHHVAPGMKVEIALEAYPGVRWSGEITRIQPRSELRDDRNVFIAEVRLDNPEGQLRPGMKGRVKVVAAKSLLGWNLLHKPWHRLADWMGW